MVFFSKVSENLETEWEKSLSRLAEHKKVDRSKIEATLGDPPKFWKGIGDEAVLVKDLSHPAQAYAAVAIFLKSMNALRSFVRGQGGNIDLKCACWLAGFPVTNKQIILGHPDARKSHLSQTDSNHLKYYEGKRLYENFLLLQHLDEESQSSGILMDYVGPQIDLGFRLAARSTPRKTMISVDLAYLLLSFDDSTANNHEWHSSKWGAEYNLNADIQFDGTDVLRGVLAGTPYPQIWLDMRPDADLNKLEDQARGTNRPAGLERTIREYVQVFFEHCRTERKINWMNLPFICDPLHQCFGTMPVGYELQMLGIQKLWEVLNEPSAPDEPEETNDPTDITDKSEFMV